MALCVNFVATAQAGTMSVGNASGVPLSGVITLNGQTETACTGYLLQTANEVGFSSLTAMLDQHFLFDPVLFTQIVGYVLVAYALGHGTGLVVKLLGWV
ncbi:MAG TPA: hypothetical protein VIF37_01475 [Methylobacter sp.]|jgi:hypothetical protein